MLLKSKAIMYKFKIQKTIMVSLAFIFNTTVAVPTIYVFGDSHALFCFNTVDDSKDPSHYYIVNVHHLFPCLLNNYTFNPSMEVHKTQYEEFPISIYAVPGFTMHRLGRDGLGALNINNFLIKQNDIVVFVFGEVDARANIGKQVKEKGRELVEVIDTLVRSYIHTIIQNKSNLKCGIKCIILNIVPPTSQCGLDNIPLYGTIQERIMITRSLNLKLNIECEKNDIIMLNVYDFYASLDGSLNPSLSDTCAHINFLYNYPIKQALLRIVHDTMA